MSASDTKKWDPEREADPPEIRALMTEGLRRLGPVRRLRSACALTSTVRDLSWKGHRLRHPDWDEATLRVEFVRMIYGSALAEGYRARWKGR